MSARLLARGQGRREEGDELGDAVRLRPLRQALVPHQGGRGQSGGDHEMDDVIDAHRAQPLVVLDVEPTGRTHPDRPILEGLLGRREASTALPRCERRGAAAAFGSIHGGPHRLPNFARATAPARSVTIVASDHETPPHGTPPRRGPGQLTASPAAGALRPRPPPRRRRAFAHAAAGAAERRDHPRRRHGLRRPRRVRRHAEQDAEPRPPGRRRRSHDRLPRARPPCARRRGRPCSPASIRRGRGSWATSRRDRPRKGSATASTTTRSRWRTRCASAATPRPPSASGTSAARWPTCPRGTASIPTSASATATRPSSSCAGATPVKDPPGLDLITKAYTEEAVSIIRERAARPPVLPVPRPSLAARPAGAVAPEFRGRSAGGALRRRRGRAGLERGGGDEGGPRARHGRAHAPPSSS